MKNKEKGELTEQIVITELMKRNVISSKPLGDNQKYDLIIDINNKLYTVQIRTCYKLDDDTMRICFQNRRINTKKQFTISLAKDVDYFIAYSYETNNVYVIGKTVLEVNNNSVVLRLNKTKNNISKGVKYANEYLLDEFLKINRELGETD